MVIGRLRLLLKRGSVVLAMVAMLVVAVHPTTAVGCSLVGPEPIGEILAAGDWQFGGSVTGVYEQRQIAWVPSLWFLRSAASVSVVDRYWGDRPSLGLSVHGGNEGFSNVGGDCGDWARPRDDTAIGVMRADSSEHYRYSYTAVGGDEFTLDSMEADLETRFGPPVVLSPGSDDYAIAYALLLWRPAMMLGVVTGLAVLATRLWGNRGMYTLRTLVVGLAAAGAIITVLLSGIFDITDLMALGAGFALAAAAAWLSRSAAALLAAAVAAYSLWRAAFGDGPPEGADLLTMGLGAGALVWTGDHWSRWPASFAMVAGWILVAGGWQVSIYLRAALIAAVTTAILWWVAIQGSKHRERNRAEAEPRITAR